MTMEGERGKNRKKKSSSKKSCSSSGSTTQLLTEGCSSLNLSSPSKSLASSPQVSPTKSPRSCHESSPYSSPTKKQCYNTVIGYIQHLSNVKRNQRNTLDYYTLVIQTGTDEYTESLLYSKAKRGILQTCQESRTALKIQRFTYTRDHTKLIINDMTHLTPADPMEYSFQYKELERLSQTETTIEEVLKADDKQMMQDVMLKAKIVHLGREKPVGQRNYRLLTAKISDDTGTIELDLWEDHIDQIQLGSAYCFSPLEIRSWDNKKRVSTLRSTEITPVWEVFEEVDLVDDDDSEVTTISVERIHTIEGVHFHLYCLKCGKRIIQLSAHEIIKCDNKKCGYLMRTKDCPKKLFVIIVVKGSSDESEELQLCIFQETLEKVLDLSSLCDDDIAKALFSWKSFEIKYNKENVVTEVIHL